MIMTGYTAAHPGAAGRTTLGPILHPLLFPLGVLVVALVLEWLVPLVSMPRIVTLPLGIVAILGGGVLMAMAGRLFRRAGTSPNPMRPTTALVMHGLYRLSRNPMYVGVSLVYLGLALVLDTLWGVLLLTVVVVALDRIVIPREERFLAARFGEEYRVYARRVPRWL
jgi:protein-S-isoprenylcysteine O-methyltransferase Ste14